MAASGSSPTALLHPVSDYQRADFADLLSGRCDAVATLTAAIMADMTRCGDAWHCFASPLTCERLTAVCLCCKQHVTLHFFAFSDLHNVINRLFGHGDSDNSRPCGLPLAVACSHLIAAAMRLFVDKLPPSSGSGVERLLDDEAAVEASSEPRHDAAVEQSSDARNYQALRLPLG